MSSFDHTSSALLELIHLFPDDIRDDANEKTKDNHAKACHDETHESVEKRLEVAVSTSIHNQQPRLPHRSR